MSFINAYRERWGIEPVCNTLQVAPSTYFAAIARRPSARQVCDAQLKVEIGRVHRDNFGVYGIEKVWRQLNREGVSVGRDRVPGSWTIWTSKVSCAVSANASRRSLRKERRGRRTWWNATSPLMRPTRSGVADLTYVSIWSGFAYVAFVTDVYSRFIVGWRVLNSLRTDLALDALEMAIWTRRRHDLTGLIHHSDRGGQGGLNRWSQPRVD